MRRKKGQHWSGTTCRVVSFKLSARSPTAFSKESREATWKSSAFPMCECIQKVRQDLENKILLRILSREAEWGVTVNMREGSHWPYSSTLICGQMEELKSINYLKWRVINTILRHFGMYSDPSHTAKKKKKKSVKRTELEALKQTHSHVNDNLELDSSDISSPWGKKIQCKMAMHISYLLLHEKCTPNFSRLK